MSSRPNVIADQRERELLADIIDSPGWNVFIARIVKVLAKQRMLDSLSNVQKGKLAEAQAALASSQSVIECVLGAYEGSGIVPPEEIRALRQQTDLIHDK